MIQGHEKILHCGREVIFDLKRDIRLLQRLCATPNLCQTVHKIPPRVVQRAHRDTTLRASSTFSGLNVVNVGSKNWGGRQWEVMKLIILQLLKCKVWEKHPQLSLTMSMLLISGFRFYLVSVLPALAPPCSEKMDVE